MNILHNFFSAAIVFSAVVSSGQAAETHQVDDAERRQLLAALSSKISESYVFPDKATLIVERLDAREKAGAYRSARNLEQLATMLTADLRHPTRDRHLGVRYSMKPVSEREYSRAPAADMERRLEDHVKAENAGIRKVETLPGNIGYIDLRNFHAVRYAKAALGAAMTLVADTNALIVDLRNNGGGDPHAVAFLSAYLFEKRTLLNTMYWREGERTDEFWTADEAPGKKFGGSKKVYVLTSKDTFSGAEEFSYNLKQLKRATIVGETTGGGAHPGRVHRIHPHLTVFIPNGRAINPISKTNWEGTGVVPDVPVKAADALRVAERLAITELLKSPIDDEHAALLRKRLNALK